MRQHAFWSSLRLDVQALEITRPFHLISRLAARYRGLSLSGQFSLVAAIIIGCSMAVLGSWVAGRIEEGVLNNTAAAAALYMNSFIEPHVQALTDKASLPTASAKTLDALVNRTDQMAAIKVWGPNGEIIYSTYHENVGKVYPVTPRLARAWQGHIEVEFNDLDDAENEVERTKALPLMEIYLPVRALGTQRIIAVAEIYAVADQLRKDIQSARQQSWIIVAILSGIMLGGLSGIVGRGSRTIRDQQNALTRRVSELTELLAENSELQERLADANRRTEMNMERFLRQIGAELHDGPAQLIGLALLRLDAVQSPETGSSPQRGAGIAIEVIRSALSDSLKEIRNLSAGLTVPELEAATLSEALALAVRNHERLTGTTICCEIASNLPKHSPAPLKICLYRFVREAMCNAFRHAGGAGQKLRASMLNDVLEVEVSDSGLGFDPESKPRYGLGLGWLSDRIQSLGGILEIHSVRGAGTRLVARFVLREAIE